ncbi:hypothetical protein PIB30_028614 [Stylosanthes scabra]|uniref:Cytochrome P450 78A5 n=1 Tax=Stylosanthes scabra TaxID=79078 RepID=A0ABU6YBJ5_9FABA|nr:hypothetical protein [Stylosanthes scabra]
MVPEFQLLFFPNLVQSPILTFHAAILALLFVLACFLWLSPGGLAWAVTKSVGGTETAIPGPSGLPLLGLLRVFTGETPHRVLAKLAKTFQAGKLMAFSVGLTQFIISSEPETAKEILGSADFADRPVKESAYELLFHRAMGFAPYGDYWRNLRRISSTHLFCPKRLTGFEEFRHSIGLNMVKEFKSMMSDKGQVEVKKVLHFGSLNNVMMMVFGKCYDFLNDDGVILEELVSEGYELLGVFNWNDHFPLLGWMDLQGVRRRCRCLVSKVNTFVGKIIEDHRVKRVSGEYVASETVGDFVDVLLDLEKENKLTDGDMIAVLWEMIFRGTDTVAILLEWVLARMVLHPEMQTKAQREIDEVVGSRPVSDSDIPNLPYLQCIVKETLRVHPPGPLLSWARLAIHNVYIGEKLIPAGTIAMINMWAITHDANVWSEPDMFKPERFMEMERDMNIMGCDLRLAPFGAGRRVCPGKSMGLASVHLWFAQLLQCFQWFPCEEKPVDLSECLKLSMEMKSPLICKAVPRVVA